MAERTRNERVLVVKKTKLGESDTIVTLLAEDGSSIRAVAKGARKPSNPFATRLELYAVSDVLVAQGRSLDIVKECRLVAGHAGLHASLEHAAAAAPLAELLSHAAQDDLPVPRLFAMSCAAYDALEQGSASAAPRLCAAALLKGLAFLGLRPSLSRCVCCGSEVSLESYRSALFSVSEGGVVCASCRSSAECVPASTEALMCAQRLLGSTFGDIALMQIDQSTVFDVLRICQSWAREHAGCRMKSLDFMFTCGLF